MDQQTFDAELKQAGYSEAASRVYPPGHATTPHVHDFDIRALVLAGDITLTTDEAATRYGEGEIFTMPHGHSHTETVGTSGVTFMVGRRAV